ncbi:MAG: response regulator transcription factor [Roseiflexaceae bacterium]|nr:response regulator transcription factor [Roseiflexaceae bacterium]
MADSEQRRPIRVLVVDDQRIVCEGIASLLSLQDGIAVVGMAFDGQQAIARAAELQPDVVLMDVRMPVLNGIAATRVIRRDMPECQVLVLTTFDDDEYIVEALDAGVVGYLLKDIPAHDLAQAIQAAHKRLYLFDRAIGGKVVAALRESASAQRSLLPPSEAAPAAIKTPALSSREIDVLRLIAQGASNREIAQALVISEGTVKAHISHILSRLGLRDRTQAALLARERGWV